MSNIDITTLKNKISVFLLNQRVLYNLIKIDNNKYKYNDWEIEYIAGNDYECATIIIKNKINLNEFYIHNYDFRYKRQNYFIINDYSYSNIYIKKQYKNLSITYDMYWIEKKYGIIKKCRNKYNGRIKIYYNDFLRLGNMIYENNKIKYIWNKRYYSKFNYDNYYVYNYRNYLF